MSVYRAMIYGTAIRGKDPQVVRLAQTPTLAAMLALLSYALRRRRVGVEATGNDGRGSPGKVGGDEERCAPGEQRRTSTGPAASRSWASSARAA